MRILVTGSSGFIGSRLVTRLLAGYPQATILGIDRSPVDLPIKQLGLDLSDDISRNEISLFRPTVVYHLAAQVDVTTSVSRPKFDGMLNYVATANLIEGLMNGDCERIVYTNSGGAIYSPDCNLPILESGEIKPSSPYGVSKFASELLLDVYARIFNYKLISLRLANVYGPGHVGGVVTKFFEAYRNGELPTIYGSGQSTRDYVYVNDVIDALILSLTTKKSQKVNISTGEQVSLIQLTEKMGKALGKKFDYEFAPSRAGEISHSSLNPDQAKENLGWNPNFTLELGLIDYLAHINKKGNL